MLFSFQKPVTTLLLMTWQ